MVRPLVEHVDAHLFPLLEDAVFREDGDAQRGEQLADAVVDLGVDVVRPSRQHHDVFALPLRLGADLVALALDIGIIGVEARKARGKPLFDERRGYAEAR